jgi:hypothetical protein
MAQSYAQLLKFQVGAKEAIFLILGDRVWQVSRLGTWEKQNRLVGARLNRRRLFLFLAQRITQPIAPFVPFEIPFENQRPVLRYTSF